MLGSAGDYRIWSYLDVTDTIKVITLRTETVDCKTWQGVSEKQPKKIFPFFDFNPQAPVAQKTADEVVFRRFQGEGVEFFKIGPH